MQTTPLIPSIRAAVPRVRMLFVAMSTLALLLLSSEPAAAVFEGQVVADGGQPAVVSVFSPNGGCTGTLIAPDRVVTAAHCGVLAQGSDPRAVKLHIGNADVAVRGFSSDRRYKLAYPFSHKFASSAIAVHDVMLIMLASPVTDVAPIPLSTVRIENAGLPTTIMGFGRSNPRGLPTLPSEIRLRTGQMQTITSAACMKSYPRAVDPATMLCVQSLKQRPYVQPCAGDSGGPLLVGEPGNLRFAGIMSWSGEVKDAECGQTRLPAIFMRATAFRALLTNPTPTLAPYSLALKATMSGVPAVGHTVTCVTAGFGGSPAKVRYQWVIQDDHESLEDAKPIDGATTARLRITTAVRKVHGKLACKIIASNDGGTVAVYSRQVVKIS